ncbi:DUF177 domain-containing protein [Aestuariicoccus sp. MJ-SS9]|uniref:YceD family protein n=1 Tax=Aestuariicoccus sp. MJ-SS9 TaxID=3079855 RepID=UPI00290A4ACD|nr:DUF177 domain-containing protein [Aestuariicoccus sp. MJ-SS9]MDU8912659.1 DUF177 domain-containing protein [Aestuariicoccus sp. MJ-SS9]
MAEFDDQTDRLRVASLSTKRETAFDLRPGEAQRAALAETLGLSALRKLRFAGTVAPEGKRGWRLDAMLGATVVQPCVVTLAPVTTRIDEPVTRLFLPEALIEPAAPEGEMEMPEDDTIDPLGDTINLGRIMAEALALALPQYPRADDAALEEAQFAADGVTPLSDDDVKPFAGLQALRDKLAGED